MNMKITTGQAPQKTQEAKKRQGDIAIKKKDTDKKAEIENAIKDSNLSKEDIDTIKEAVKENTSDELFDVLAERLPHIDQGILEMIAMDADLSMGSLDDLAESLEDDALQMSSANKPATPSKAEAKKEYDGIKQQKQSGKKRAIGG